MEQENSFFFAYRASYPDGKIKKRLTRWPSDLVSKSIESKLLPQRFWMPAAASLVECAEKTEVSTPASFSWSLIHRPTEGAPTQKSKTKKNKKVKVMSQKKFLGGRWQKCK